MEGDALAIGGLYCEFGIEGAHLAQGETMPVHLREQDIVEVMDLFKKYRKRGHGVMDACRRVEADMGIPFETVYQVQRRMRPTNEAATTYLKSQSLRLAMRVVRKANVDQAIGILSRPNIGVLDSASEGGGGGGRQFMIGVAMDSLGSVKVGVQIGATEPRSSGRGGMGTGSEEVVGPLHLKGDVSPDEALEPGPVGDELLEDDGDGDRPPRKWRDKRAPQPKLEPAPLPAGATNRSIGGSLEFRLAQAKAQRKEEATARRKDKERINKRAKELGEQLRAARENLDKR